MLTNIKVTIYKESGKYLTHEDLETSIPVYETIDLIEFIKKQLEIISLSFTFYAESDIGINNHLHIN